MAGTRTFTSARGFGAARPMPPAEEKDVGFFGGLLAFVGAILAGGGVGMVVVEMNKETPHPMMFPVFLGAAVVGLVFVMLALGKWGKL